MSGAIQHTCVGEINLAHVTPTDRQALMDGCHPGLVLGVIDKGRGYLVYLDRDEDPDQAFPAMSAAFRNCLRFAAGSGLEYVRFDFDSPTYDFMPIFKCDEVEDDEEEALTQ